MANEKATTPEIERLKDFIIIALIKLAGACERPRISKKDIQGALKHAQKEIEEWKA